MLLTRTAIFASAILFCFICWIIFLADTGAPNYFIDAIRRIPGGDKLGHMWLYGLLSLALSYAWRDQPRGYLGLPLGCALVLAFAILEECTQAFFPTRTLDFADVAADYIGVQLASWFTGRNKSPS